MRMMAKKDKVNVNLDDMCHSRKTTQVSITCVFLKDGDRKVSGSMVVSRYAKIIP